jgi:hypothetical protein
MKENARPRDFSSREAILVAIALFSVVAALFIAPYANNPSYHDFADSRGLFGVPNFANVISNVPFLIVGLMGFAFCVKSPMRSRESWALFFLGVSLVSIGSGYYHWAPENESLVWDRLPMTLAFTGLFIALLSEHVSAVSGRFALVIALLTGVASVVLWRQTGQLWLYVWVQLVPLVMIPAVAVLYPAKFTHRVYLLYGLAWYAFAKIAELYDREIFALTSHALSGHAIKHLLAALSVVSVYLMLRRRTVLNP